MSDYDKATAALIADLEAAPKSYARDEIIERAKRGRYHDYREDSYSTPKLKLYQHLVAAGLHELAQRTKDGAYDQHKEDADEWARSKEGQQIFAALMQGAAKGELLSGTQPTPNPDDADQSRLRAISADIRKLLEAYDVGGVLLLVSKKSSAWEIVIPKWCGIQPGERGEMRIRMSSKTPEGRELGDATMGFIASVRDAARDVGSMFASMWMQVKAVIEANGGKVEHHPFGGKGGRGPSGNLPQ